MSNQFNLPKIVSSRKISGIEEHKTTVEKLIKFLGYRKIKIFGLDTIDASIKSNEPILFTFNNSKLNQIKKFNKQKFVRFATNKVGKLTKKQEKIKKCLSTVPIYTVVDERNDLVMSVPHSFLEPKKEDRNNWEIPIYFSFLDKNHADFYCQDLNEEFSYLNKTFEIRTLNLGLYYELVYTQGSGSLFYLFPDLEGIKSAKSLSKTKLAGIGIPSFGYKSISVKDSRGNLWDGKFFDPSSGERITPVFLNCSDAIKYWKKFRKLETGFKLPNRPQIEYLKLDRQIFRTEESEFLSKNFVFFPSTDYFKNTK
jgi:hypothetical protein